MIIKKDELLKKFNGLTKKEQDKIVSHILTKSNTKLHVYDFQAKTIMITASFNNAFDKAFLQGYKGHFQSNSNLDFYKSSPSMITNTISNLFEKCIDYLNITPNVIYKELRKQKLME